jgi:F-type H+-transporting ATPase subunit b
MHLPRILTAILLVLLLGLAAPVAAQEHATPAQPAQGQSPVPEGAQPPHDVDDAHAAEEEHGNPIVQTGARLLNFAILAGILVYFLRMPIANYLSSRSTQIRQDLVTASEMRATATAQLAEIDKKMQALPAELDALRRQGAEDVKAEGARIAQAAAAERARLLEQTRREIDMRLRIARRELTEHAARLAVQVAETRIRRSITPDDQIRLVDRYASQLREGR